MIHNLCFNDKKKLCHFTILLTLVQELYQRENFLQEKLSTESRGNARTEFYPEAKQT